jgi:hypothetical protein
MSVLELGDQDIDEMLLADRLGRVEELASPASLL